MNLLLACLLISYLIALPIFFHSLTRLKAELIYLPVNEAINSKGSHPIVGAKTTDILQNSDWFPQTSMIIMTAAPDCPVCKSELEEMLSQNHGEYFVPVIVFLIDDHSGAKEQYLQMYSSLVSIVPIEITDFEKLNILITPSYIVVDKTSKVISVHAHFLEAKKLYWEYIKVQMSR